MKQSSHVLIWILFFIGLIGLSACNLARATPVAVAPPQTGPLVRIAQIATATPAATEQPIIPTNTPVSPTVLPTATTTPYVCTGDWSGEAIQHQVTATIDYAAKSADVAQLTRYHNQTGQALNELVFDVQANQYVGAFSLDRLTISDKTPDYSINRNRLTVPLLTPLPDGCAAAVAMQFTISVPQIESGIGGYRGYFGYGDRQLNLALWLPTVAPRGEKEWLIHEPARIGEQLVLQQADWDVTLTVENASNIIIAAPGQAEQLAPDRWQYVFNGGRDFSISLSESFRVTRETTDNGVTVELYHFADTTRYAESGAQVNGAQHAVDEAVKAIEQYTSLFGAYPHDRMVIVQGDFPDGMEFSGLVFVGTAWFYSFEGGVQNYLTVITIHEVAHQWWYSQVGSDNANDPWLDEALATYSEYVYYEEFYPALKNWWWSFRVGWYNPQGNVDSRVYEFDDGRAYINAVYLRGVQMLHNIRDDIGTEAFFDLLAAYADVGRGEIVSSEVFWSLLTPKQYADTAATRSMFLRQPDVIVLDEMNTNSEESE